MFVPLSNAGEAAGKKRPLTETLWNVFGVIFYILMAVGTVYHMIY
jgi:hypothetical protein